MQPEMGAGGQPEVSVVIPTHGRWRLLSRTLHGVLSQCEVNLEAVVIDDASRDGTASHIRALGDARVRCISNPRPFGVASCRNRGIADARGEWVAFLDDDDLWAPRKLRTQLDRAADAGADFVYCSAVVVDDGLRVLLTDPAPDPSILAEQLLVDNAMPAGSSNVLAHAELLRRIGGFDESLGPLADWDLWIRLFDAGCGAACEETLVAYVEHGAGMHTVDLAARPRELAYLAAKHAEACRRLGVKFGGESLALQEANRRRAEGHRLQSARTYFRVGMRQRRPRVVARALVSLFGDSLVQPMRRMRGSVQQAPEWLNLYG